MIQDANFTKEKAKEAQNIALRIFNAVPKSKQFSFLGELNELCLFLEAAQRHINQESTDNGPTPVI